MSLEATCISCQQPYLYLASQKAAQTGLCVNCQRTADIEQMNNELNLLQHRIDRILPSLKQLNTAKKLASAAYDAAYNAWERKARVHAALDRTIAITTYERDLLLGAKELATRKGSKARLTDEQKAKKALDGLDPEIRAALIKSFIKEEE